MRSGEAAGGVAAPQDEGEAALLEALLHVFHPLLTSVADAFNCAMAFSLPQQEEVTSWRTETVPCTASSFSQPTPVATAAIPGEDLVAPCETPCAAPPLPAASLADGGSPSTVSSARSPWALETTEVFADGGDDALQYVSQIQQTPQQQPLLSAMEAIQQDGRDATDFGADKAVRSCSTMGSAPERDSPLPPSVTSDFDASRKLPSSPLSPTAYRRLRKDSYVTPSLAAMDTLSPKDARSEGRARAPLPATGGADGFHRSLLAPSHSPSLAPQSNRLGAFVSLPNAVVWDAVAALVEATLLDGLCTRWMVGVLSLPHALDRAHRRRDRRSRPKDATSTVMGLDATEAKVYHPAAPARMLNHSLLHFDAFMAAVSKEPLRCSGFARRSSPITKDGDSSLREAERGLTNVLPTVSAEMQDTIFRSFIALLVRSVAVWAAHLVGPLLFTHLAIGNIVVPGALSGGSREAEEGGGKCDGETHTDASDATPCASPLSPTTLKLPEKPPGNSDSPPSSHGEPSALRSLHGALEPPCALPTSSPIPLQQQQQGLTWPTSWSGRTTEEAMITPSTFRKAQEELRENHQRLLKAQQQQQPRQRHASPVSALCTGSTSSLLASFVNEPGAGGASGDTETPTGPSSLAPFAIASAPPTLDMLVHRAEMLNRCSFCIVWRSSHHGCNRQGAKVASTSLQAEPGRGPFSNQVDAAALRSTGTTMDSPPSLTIHAMGSALPPGVVKDVVIQQETTALSCLSPATKPDNPRKWLPSCMHHNESDACRTGLCSQGETTLDFTLVTQWCEGVEKLAATMAVAQATCENFRGSSAPLSAASSAAELYASFLSSMVNPPMEILAEYVAETVKAANASSAHTLPPSTAVGCDGAASGAVSSPSPWSTAQLSVRPPFPSHPYLLGPASMGDSPGCESLKKCAKTYAAQVASAGATAAHLPPIEWLRLTSAPGSDTAPLFSVAGRDGLKTLTGLPTTVERSTAALFAGVLSHNFMSADATPRRRASTEDDVLSPLEEVGAVLAAVDAACAGRTLVNASAWRYGRNRINVAAASVISVTELQENDPAIVESSPARCTSIPNVETKLPAPSLSESPDMASSGTGEENFLDLRILSSPPSPSHSSSSSRRVVLGVYHHESGVLQVTDGQAYALEV